MVGRPGRIRQRTLFCTYAIDWFPSRISVPVPEVVVDLDRAVHEVTVVRGNLGWMLLFIGLPGVPNVTGCRPAARGRR